MRNAFYPGMAAGALLLFLGCSRSSERINSSQAPAPPEKTLSSEERFASALPHVGGPSGYVGSRACQNCHQDQYESWHRSYHRTMTQIASDESVQADFNHVVLPTETARFTLNKRGGEYWVHMEPLVQSAPEGGQSAGLDARLGLVTGSHHMQVFWVPEGHGNIQLGFPFTWLIPEKRWVPRNSTFVRPPDLPHHSEIWNVVCSRCHTTGVEPRAHIAERDVQTRVGELGIACEACHGPGRRHVESQNTAATRSSASQKSLEPGEIIHPKKLGAERAAQICGFCHSMKWIDHSENWKENGFHYRPGDDLEATTPTIRPSSVHKIPGLEDYLARNPELLADFFWPDGMIRVSGRDYNGLIESPCYKSGKFSCLSCHSLHESEPAGQLAAKAKGNGACIQCHEQFKESAQLAAHSHHKAESSGSECYNCHMPHTTYGVLKAIRSHQISSPRVATDLATGRPNACNLCHLDRTLRWTSETLREWYGQEQITFPPEAATNVSHLVNLALSGDAGQRVLAAWHFSWPPALQASGTNWIAPVLGQLLDDPYAGIRCVAERSLRSVSDLTPAEYDYPTDVRARPSAREKVWAAWEQRQNEALSEGRAEALLSWPKQPERMRTAFEERLKARNDRPVRLRE